MTLDPETAVKTIAARVSAETGLPVKEILGSSRLAQRVAARQAVMFEARALGFSYPLIGRVMKRDHTTVMSAVRREAMRRGCEVPAETKATVRPGCGPQVRKMSPERAEEYRRLRAWSGSVHYRGLRLGRVTRLIADMPVAAQHALEDRASRRGETLAEALASAWLERVSA